MDSIEAEENLFTPTDAKLHAKLCEKLYVVICKVLPIIPEIEATKPGRNFGMEELCSLHVELGKAKNLIQHCSECSKLYLAITRDAILAKFKKAGSSLQEILKRVDAFVPRTIGCKILEILNELENTQFELDKTEKQVGDEVIALLRKRTKIENCSIDNSELEAFFHAATKLELTSLREALSERRALKKVIQRARADCDNRKESIAAYLLHLMRTYSQHFKSETTEDADSQGSSPCSPNVQGSTSSLGKGQVFERQLSRLSSLNLQQDEKTSENVPIAPEELMCSLSSQLMYDPVIIASGQTYERVCIEKWFNDGHTTCPKTKQELDTFALTANHCVKGLITTWCEQNGVLKPDGPPEALDLNYWRLAVSAGEGTEPCSSKSAEGLSTENVNGIRDSARKASASADNSVLNSEPDKFQNYNSILGSITDGQGVKDRQKAVEHIRLVLKHDEEARVYMGANGLVEPLVHFLTLALQEGDAEAQEDGAMALFNLAVNNDRNKELLLSSEVMSLLEEMIQNSGTCELAAAVFLNLSCLDKAKPIIASSKALDFLVHILHMDTEQSISCRQDALYTVLHLTTNPSSIPFLLSTNIAGALCSLLTNPPSVPRCTVKVLAILQQLASVAQGKREIVSTPGMVTAIAAVIDSDNPAEQEQAVACLLILCTEDNDCIRMVLEEGVIPGLLMVSADGSERGKDNAQQLLKLFREQRQQESSPEQQNISEISIADPQESPDLQRQRISEISIADNKESPEQQNRSEIRNTDSEASPEQKPLSKSKSKILGRSLTAFWKHKRGSSSSSKSKSKS